MTEKENARPLGGGAGRRETTEQASSTANCSTLAGSQPREAKAFQLTGIADLLDPPDSLRWLVPHYLLPESLALLCGDPATGKSLLALRWAVDLALAGQPVVIIAGEGHFGLRRRLKALAQHLNQEAALREAPLAISNTGAALVDPNSLRAVIEAIDAWKSAHGAPVLIIIDTLHRNLGPADENSSKDVAIFVGAADTLRTRYKAAVLVVHHSGHGNKDRARGSSALWGAVDTELRLEGEADGDRFLTVTKMKDGPTPDPAAFRLEQTTLPWVDAEGAPETSVFLVPTGVPFSGQKPAKQSASVRLGLETLHAALDAHGTAPPWSAPQGETLPERVVAEEHWRQKFYDKNPSKNQDAKKKAFQRTRRDLTNQKSVGERDGQFWPLGSRPTPAAGKHRKTFFDALHERARNHFSQVRPKRPAQAGHGTKRDIGGTCPGLREGERDRRDTPL